MQRPCFSADMLGVHALCIRGRRRWPESACSPPPRFRHAFTRQPRRRCSCISRLPEELCEETHRVWTGLGVLSLHKPGRLSNTPFVHPTDAEFNRVFTCGTGTIQEQHEQARGEWFMGRALLSDVRPSENPADVHPYHTRPTTLDCPWPTMRPTAKGTRSACQIAGRQDVVIHAAFDVLVRRPPSAMGRVGVSGRGRLHDAARQPTGISQGGKLVGGRSNR